MTATAANAIKLAASQNGYQESPTGSNHTKYGVWFGVDPAPWCAMYLSWVWWSIGLRFTGAQTAKGWASAESMHQWFIKHNRMVTTPRAGDVMFWHFYGEHAGANHVDLFVSIPQSGWVRGWDGNTSTSSDRDGGHVERRDRPRKSAKGYLIGFGRPPYVAGTTTTKPPLWWTRTQLLTSPYMHGTDVAAAAKRLTAKGYPTGLPADIFGPQMDGAVRAFQKAHGLLVDGDIGPTTASALGA